MPRYLMTSEYSYHDCSESRDACVGEGTENKSSSNLIFIKLQVALRGLLQQGDELFLACFSGALLLEQIGV